MEKELEYLGRGARAARRGRSWRSSAARRSRTRSRSSRTCSARSTRCSSAARWPTRSSRRRACRSASRWSRTTGCEAPATVDRARRQQRGVRSSCRSITSSRRSSKPARRRRCSTSTDPAIGDRMGLDIGPKTAATYAAVDRRREDRGLERPDGRVRDPEFAEGTEAVARAVAAVNGTTIVGGGDSIAAVNKVGRRRQDHAHLHRRRRVARVPRRPGAAGRRGAER